ncbi:MAG: hypothetical protein IAB19_07585 [Proteobacteria bacterium]|uniref:Uncharacterized protein n=1 Tax=Candidatus Avisuccinivibrio stercorigallinarum TaxID=2840704 RepID=A0A9D9DF29_9GAMM|nr:hypothetical protein [Candidatus Avisuccinivibrio stercorigallinarum]
MARISISRLAQYAGGIELLSLSSPSFSSILLQGPLSAARRIEKSGAACSFLHPQLPEHVLKPISFKVAPEQKLAQAVFEGQSLSKLQPFLQQGTLLQQYSAGKRLGFMLRKLHELMMPSELTQTPGQWRKQCEAAILSYFKSPYRFANDAAALTSLQRRLNFMFAQKLVLTAGSIKSRLLFVGAEGQIVLRPLLKLKAAPAVRDFVQLSAADSADFPCFTAGAVDGYFGAMDKTKFWLSLALYCAYYATAGLAAELAGREARQRAGELDLAQFEQSLAAAERQSRRLCRDFNDFTHPIPRWYKLEEVEQVRRTALRLGL